MTCLIVHLFARPGCEHLLSEYEDKALSILVEHGAVIDLRMKPRSGPTEIHVIRLPDPATFERYKVDSRIRDLAELRDRAILKTEVFEGECAS